MEYSVVIPVYREAESLTALCDRIFHTFKSMGKESAFDILFVDDGSTDSSRQILKRLCKERHYVKSIFLRKNSGKAIAITTGFLYAKGDFIITIDGDLQDNPEDIPVMVKKINEGYDLVSGWRRKRQDGLVRACGSWAFNWVVSCSGGLRLHDFNCGFKIYRAKVIKSIFVYGQYHRFIPLLAYLNGFKVAEAPVSHSKRKYGSSKYPALRYHGFFDLLSILFIYRYRFSPLYFFGTIGGLLIFPSFLTIFYLGGRHLLYLLGFGEKYILVNRPLISVSFLICAIGVNIFLAGFICDFILYHDSKRRVVESAEGLIEEILYE